MMRGAILGLVAAAVLLPAAAFADSESDYQQLLATSCPKEIKTYCKDVAPGDARMLACLYAREDKLSGPCVGAVMTSADRLKTAIISMSDVKQVCANDVRNLCPDVVAGKGNLVQCLTIAKKRVSQKCNAALDGAFLR